MRAWAVCAVLAASLAEGAELGERTARAFEAYAQAVEARPETPFLWVDTLAPAEREARLREMRNGGLVIERLRERLEGREMEAPGGLIHHWLGSVFVPGVTLGEALTLLRDYDRHATVYAPNVARSRLLAKAGDDYRFFLRLSMHKVITVIVNSEHRAVFASRGLHRARSWIRSTRIAEVRDPGSADESEEPVGQGGGYLWRLNTYWRFDERDGGVYLECESISLTRGIPYGLGWMIGPFVTSIPKESLEFTLQTTRNVLRRDSVTTASR